MLFKRKKKDKVDNTDCFIVACHGWSGSHWFSHVLNLHPDVICTHSASNLNSNDVSMHTLEDLKRRTIERYLNIRKKRQKSIDQYYNEITGLGEAKSYGSVHLFQIKDIKPLIEIHGETEREYKIINQVRHPLSFVWSGYGQLADLFEFDVWVIKGTLDLIFTTHEDYFLSLHDKYGLNLATFDVMAFVGACANLLNLGSDVRHCSEYEFVPMEKLTSDRVYFSEIFEKITSIKPNDKYLEEVFDLGGINNHKRAKKLSPEDRYATFEDWQKDVFKEFLKLSGMRPKYESIGYSFDFIDD